MAPSTLIRTSRSPYLLALAAVLVAVGACDTLTGNGASITIANGASLDLPWGDTVALTVLDEGGTPISDGRVSWSSAQAGIASVSADGVVTGEELGATVIRASVGGAEASIRVEVVVEGAEDIMRIRISGDVEEEYIVRPDGGFSFAVALQAEFLDRTDWQFGYVLGETYSVSRDVASGVTFAFPGRLTPGSYELTPAAPDDVTQSAFIELTGPIAYLYRETGNRTLFAYPVTSGTLDITALDSLTISFADGSVRGASSFEADEYRQTYDPAAGDFTLTATGRSVEVDVIFHVPAGIYHGGFMDVTVAGGAYASPQRIEGWADGDDDPTYGTTLDLVALDAEGGPVSLGVAVADPAVGTMQVGSGPMVRWRQYTSGGYLEAGADSGTITFTELVEPTPGAWGVARGELDVTLRVGEQSDQAAGEAMAIAGTFAVPIAPIPRAAPRPAGDRAGATAEQDGRQPQWSEGPWVPWPRPLRPAARLAPAR